MKKALVLLAPGFEEIEAVTIIDILRRAQIKVLVTGLERDLVKGSHHISIQPDAFYKDINAAEFDMLILPGGQPGSTNLKNNPNVLKWIQDGFNNQQALAAICAAPTVFHAAGITDQLKLTSYPSEEMVFDKSIYLTDTVVKDGSVITSRGVGTAIDFALALVEQLSGPQTAAEIKEKILY